MSAPTREATVIARQRNVSRWANSRNRPFALPFWVRTVVSQGATVGMGLRPFEWIGNQ